MRILVLGGTGFIGPHTIRKLAADGHQVTVFHRGKKHAELPPSVHYMTGDYKKLPEFAGQFRDLAPEVVMDMIPITEQDAHNTVNTFRGIARRVVAASSQDVYRAWAIVINIESGTTDPHVTEDSPLRQVPYPYRGKKIPIQVEWDMENYDKVLVERIFMSDRDLPATIIRIPMTYGEGDYAHRMFSYLKRMDDGREVIPLEQSAARVRLPLGYVEDVGAAIALAVTNDRAAGRIYNVAELDVRSTAAWVREIGESIGWKGRVVEVADGSLPGPWSAYNLKQHVIPDTTRIRQELGYREIVPRNEAIRRTVEWERAHPPEPFPSPLFDYEAEDRVLAAKGPTATSGAS